MRQQLVIAALTTLATTAHAEGKLQNTFTAASGVQGAGLRLEGDKRARLYFEQDYFDPD